MAKKWTKLEIDNHKYKLAKLYVNENKTIGQISKILNMSESGVYGRLVKLKIPINRNTKYGFNNINRSIILPAAHSPDLAEFMGTMLGDGHITKTQVTVTLGIKDDYANYVAALMKRLFKAKPKILTTKRGDKVVYFGSAGAVKWLLKEGLAFNKTRAQVSIPAWIYSKPQFLKSVLRGLLDTDGSIYALKNGQLQISFSNLSIPLLTGVRKAFQILGFCPSKVSVHSVYLTRKSDVAKYLNEIGFCNNRHNLRVKNLFNGRFV